MRKLQNIVSNFGNVFVGQGNVLVAIVESSRALRASSTSALYLDALSLASRLGLDAWQRPITTGPATSFFDVKPVGTAKRRHAMIMCHRAAA